LNFDIISDFEIRVQDFFVFFLIASLTPAQMSAAESL